MCLRRRNLGTTRSCDGGGGLGSYKKGLGRKRQGEEGASPKGVERAIRVDL